MNDEMINKRSNLEDEPIVIADECGDSMWDEVLGQQVNACDIKKVSKNAAALLNSINAAEESAMDGTGSK
jgi:hypothetical protein